MDPVVEETMFRLCHMIFYMNLDNVSHNFCIKNDPIITDPSFEKPKLKKKINSKMIDWDEEEAKYLANPEKYLQNIGKELDLQREIQNQRKLARPEAGVKRNYNERYQSGFYQTFPSKAAKRLACPTGHFLVLFFFKNFCLT